MISGCGEEGEDLFPGEVSKNRGVLRVLNSSGFMGATLAGTSLDFKLELFAAGGLDILDLSAVVQTTDPIDFKGGFFPGDGGTCGPTLISGQSCFLILTYEPENTASHQAQLMLSYRDSLGAQSLSYLVSADSNPILQFEYGKTYEFGNKFVGSSTDLRVRISNVGRVVAESLSVGALVAPFSYRGGSFPGVGGSCGNRLVPGETCDIVITYAPTNNGSHDQKINLNYLNTGRAEVSTLDLVAWGFYESELDVDGGSSIQWGTLTNGLEHDLYINLVHKSGDVAVSNISLSGLGGQFGFKGGSFPGSGGSCSETLTKAQGSCTVVLTMTSAVSGNWSRAITISYFNGRSTRSLSRNLSGSTRQKAVLSFSPSSAVDFGIVRSTTSGERTITVTHLSGELPATNLSIGSMAAPFGYKNGLPMGGGTCTSSISPGTSCSVVLAYSPTTIGTHANTEPVSISFFDGGQTVSSTLSLSGRTQALLSPSSGSLGFGTIVQGQTSQITLTLNYSGGASASSILISTSASPFSVASTTCGSSQSSSCTVVVRFAPTAIGSFSANLNLSYHDGIQTQSSSVPLSGSGGEPAVVSVGGWDFGQRSVNSQTLRTLTVSNSSATSATITTASLPSGFQFRGGSFPGGGTCTGGRVLSLGQSCTMGVVFAPTTQTSYSGQVTLTYNNGAGSTTASSTVSGSAIETSEIFISDFDKVEFGDAYIGATGATVKTFVIKQGGSSAAATGISPSFSPTGEFNIVPGSNTCSGTLARNESCSFQVAFSPSASGTRESTLSISYSGGTVARILTGTGRTPAALSISSPPANIFNSQPTGSATDVTLTVTRSGSVLPVISSTVKSGSGFEIVSSLNGQSGACPAGSMSAVSCTIVVRFTPTQVTNYNGTVGLRFYNGFTYVNAEISLSGSGAPSARLSAAPSTGDFGTLIQSQSSSMTITLSHSGDVAAQSMSAAALSAPFSFKGGSYPGVGGTCGASLSASQGTCTVVVDFKPTTTGSYTQNLIISYDGASAGTQQAIAALSGRAVAQAIVSLSVADPLDFGTVTAGSSADRTVRLTNSGGVSAADLAISLNSNGFAFKGGSYPGVGGSCGSSLAAQGSCDVVLTFSPQAPMVYTGSFNLVYHDGLRSQNERRDLRGTGQ